VLNCFFALGTDFDLLLLVHLLMEHGSELSLTTLLQKLFVEASFHDSQNLCQKSTAASPPMVALRSHDVPLTLLQNEQRLFQALSKMAQPEV
jgi:hypothetical protein